MSTKRLWAIAGGAAALVAIIVLIATLFAPSGSDASPTPSASAPASPTATPSATASPTPTHTGATTTTAPPVDATCDDISTDAFRAMMSSNGWVSWQTQNEAIGARPFDGFPNGSPAGALICRWGTDPDLATDDVIDLAWSPIDPENAVAAMQKLAEEGFVRTDAPEGVYLAMNGRPGFTDAEGWGETYLFTLRDVRWAATKSDVASYVKAPTEAE